MDQCVIRIKNNEQITDINFGLFRSVNDEKTLVGVDESPAPIVTFAGYRQAVSVLSEPYTIPLSPNQTL